MPKNVTDSDRTESSVQEKLRLRRQQLIDDIAWLVVREHRHRKTQAVTERIKPGSKPSSPIDP